MIKTLGIRGFKCFNERKDISFRPVTILYGKNGRGKSTVSQVLLLLGQSMRKNNSLNQLVLNDGYVSQGSFDELINKGNSTKSIEFFIEADANESVSVTFEQFKPVERTYHIK